MCPTFHKQKYRDIAELCFTLPSDLTSPGLLVIVDMAERADQGFCLMCHLRWEDTFQMTGSDKKGGVAERVTQHCHP